MITFQLAWSGKLPQVTTHQSNKSYQRKKLWFIYGQWSWDFLDGHCQCNSMAAPKGAEAAGPKWALPVGAVVLWVTLTWANHFQTDKINDTCTLCFLWLPFHHRKHSERLKQLHSEAIIFFTLFANWYSIILWHKLMPELHAKQNHLLDNGGAAPHFPWMTFRHCWSLWLLTLI